MAIKAEKTINILTRAIYLFTQIPVPKDSRIRQAFLMQKESNIDLWDALDTEFENNTEDIAQLTIDFVRKNSANFD